MMIKERYKHSYEIQEIFLEHVYYECVGAQKENSNYFISIEILKIRLQLEHSVTWKPIH